MGETDIVWPKGWVCSSCGYAVPVLDGVPMFARELANAQTYYEPKHFAMLAAVEREHFWFVARNRLIVGLIARYFPAATSFLEIGCGTGTVLSAIADSRPGLRLTASELHSAGLREARRRLGERATFVQLDARSIPAREVFDVVGAFDVIEHIAEDEEVLTAMSEAARRGGGVILAVPQHPFLWSDFDEKAHHVRRYRRGELEQKTEKAGMRVVFSGSYAALLFPLMATSRLLRGRTKANRKVVEHTDTVPVEFRLPRMLNAFVRCLLQMEVSATLAGARFPFGGSRIVVAIKG